MCPINYPVSNLLLCPMYHSMSNLLLCPIYYTVSNLLLCVQFTTQCPIYYTVSNLLLCVQFTTLCPIYYSVSNLLLSVQFTTQCPIYYSSLNSHYIHMLNPVPALPHLWAWQSCVYQYIRLWWPIVKSLWDVNNNSYNYEEIFLCFHAFLRQPDTSIFLISFLNFFFYLIVQVKNCVSLLVLYGHTPFCWCSSRVHLCTSDIYAFHFSRKIS